MRNIFRLSAISALFALASVSSHAGIDVALLSLADHLATYGGPGPDESWAALLAVVRTLLDTYFTSYGETVAPGAVVEGLVGVGGVEVVIVNIGVAALGGGAQEAA